MARIKVNKVIIGNGVDLKVLVTGSLSAKLRKGDRLAYDALHSAIQSNKDTGKVIESSLQTIILPANEYLGAMLESLARTLNDEGSFSSTVTSGGGKRVAIKPNKAGVYTPATVAGTGWARLTPSYLKRVGVIRGKSGRPKKSDKFSHGGAKRWWYERNRQGSKSSDVGSQSTGEGAMEELLALAKEIGGFNKKLISSTGRANKFTISAGVRKNVRRTHVRTSSKGNKFIVYGVKGQLQGPTSLTIQHALAPLLTDITLKALMTSQEQRVSKSAASIYKSAGRDDWLANVLANEAKRPWVSKFFASGGRSGLIKHIQAHVLDVA